MATTAKTPVTNEIPAVWSLRLPTEAFCSKPDGKTTAQDCSSVVLGVDDGKVQEYLWQFDKNHDHVLSSEDVIEDPIKNGGIVSIDEIPVGARKVADIYINAQNQVGSNRFFSSTEQMFVFAITSRAINDAYETVEWLKRLQYLEIKESGEGCGFLGKKCGEAVRFTLYLPQDWSEITKRFLYADPIETAFKMFDGMVGVIPSLHTQKATSTFQNVSEAEKKAIFTYYAMDTAEAPYSVRTELTEMSRKLAVINEFTHRRTTTCNGERCLDVKGYYEQPKLFSWENDRGIAILLHVPPFSETSWVPFEGSKGMLQRGNVLDIFSEGREPWCGTFEQTESESNPD